MKRSRTVRTVFRSPRESTLWVAEMNERHCCYEAAAPLFRSIGMEERAQYCERKLAEQKRETAGEAVAQ